MISAWTSHIYACRVEGVGRLFLGCSISQTECE